MLRVGGRKNDQLRKISITKNYLKHVDGSCLIEFGDTRIVCSALLEEGVPPFLRNTATGWLTAEYGMLPGSCAGRIRRNTPTGRMYEIQRLIGRSLRAVVDLQKIGERTIKIDCDVIQADGGTRTASITGSFIALHLAYKKWIKRGMIEKTPFLLDYIAAISVGIVDGENLLDLNYEEDSSADMDMNVVMTGRGQLIEIQATAEKNPFSKTQLDSLLKLAEKGIKELIALQKKNLTDLELIHR